MSSVCLSSEATGLMSVLPGCVKSLEEESGGSSIKSSSQGSRTGLRGQDVFSTGIINTTGIITERQGCFSGVVRI